MTELTFTSDLTVELIQHAFSDQIVTHAARVSTKGQAGDLSEPLTNKDAGLISYLMRDLHLSPFEHGIFTFFVHAPIFVFRQWQRHRTWSYNEESGRYTVLKPVFYVPSDGRPLVQHGKVGHYTFEMGTDSQLAMVRKTMETACKQSYHAYERMLENKVAPEMARAVLPVTIYSSMYASVDPRNLMGFLSLRMDPHAQFEIQQMAKMLYLEMVKVCPTVIEAWEKYQFKGSN